MDGKAGARSLAERCYKWSSVAVVHIPTSLVPRSSFVLSIPVGILHPSCVMMLRRQYMKVGILPTLTCVMAKRNLQKDDRRRWNLPHVRLREKIRYAKSGIVNFHLSARKDPTRSTSSYKCTCIAIAPKTRAKFAYLQNRTSRCVYTAQTAQSNRS
jgi:hypothetical protein